ncbi:MAG TPA: hypothetical protein VFC01_12840, partial [Mycobacterium sp.]|nr:hypothetical protein [Mycobacterium sp.]
MTDTVVLRFVFRVGANEATGAQAGDENEYAIRKSIRVFRHVDPDQVCRVVWSDRGPPHDRHSFLTAELAITGAAQLRILAEGHPFTPDMLPVI